ncbi:MAG TPA: hypothetical protein VLZ77_14125 [Acidimicrobiales bacterium]|nr:hypothetical protein [Acidimicrobiales bacterium]
MGIIDITTFSLADGVTDDQFRQADATMQAEHVYRQPGIVRRTTARGEGGRWLVVTLWATRHDAEAAEGAARADAVATGFARLLDATTVTSARYETLD